MKWNFLGVMLLAKVAMAESSCGVIQQWSGDVSLLNHERSHVEALKEAQGVPCGAWLSVRSGWVHLNYQNGAVIRIGPQSSVQLTAAPDHLILMQGYVYVELDEGLDEFRVVTASSRGRIKKGRMLIVENEKLGTQLIALQYGATLENRFSFTQKVDVLEGESSSFSARGDRIIPSLPQVVSLASLRPYVNRLHLKETDILDVMHAVLQRKNRKFEGSVIHPVVVHSEVDSVAHSRDVAHYLSRPLGKGSDVSEAALQEQWVQKIVAGESDAVPLVSPEKQEAKPATVQLEVLEIPERRSASQIDVREKKYLLETLSKLYSNNATTQAVEP